MVASATMLAVHRESRLEEIRYGVGPPAGPMRTKMDTSGTPQAQAKPRVQVHVETEAVRGWSYEVVIRWPDGTESAHDVTLCWRDHDYWSGGASAPSRVVQAVVEYVLGHWEGLLPARFDAARARWWCRGIDEELRETL